MAYYLSEAYQDLYNPRVESYVDNNLQFIDYLQEEDIQEVVESLFWEFRDYGMTYDEAFDALKYVASEDVVNESMEYLTEARVTVGKDSQSEIRNLQRQARRKRIDGGISRVKAAFAGAKGGIGGAIKKAGGYFSKQTDDAKARLGRLLRTGMGAVEKGATRVGGEIKKAATRVGDELSGRAAERSRQQKLLRQFKQTSRRAAARTDTSAFEKPRTGMSPEVDAATERYKGGFLKNRARRSTLSRMGEKRSASAAERQRRLGSKRTGTGTPTQLDLPLGNVGAKMSPQTANISGLVRSKRYGAAPKRKGGSGVKQGSFLRQVGGEYSIPKMYQQREEVDYDQIYGMIITDLIDEGYAIDFDNAIDLIESFSEETLDELIETYLD